jgi:hypothetical protein
MIEPARPEDSARASSSDRKPTRRLSLRLSAAAAAAAMLRPDSDSDSASRLPGPGARSPGGPAAESATRSAVQVCRPTRRGEATSARRLPGGPALSLPLCRRTGPGPGRRETSAARRRRGRLRQALSGAGADELTVTDSARSGTAAVIMWRPMIHR